MEKKSTPQEVSRNRFWSLCRRGHRNALCETQLGGGGRKQLCWLGAPCATNFASGWKGCTLTERAAA